MTGDLPPWSAAAQAFKPGLYRHFKGKEYLGVGVALHSETFEEMVVYKNSAGELRVRPLAMWNEHVDRDGHSGPRFTFVREA